MDIVNSADDKTCSICKNALTIFDVETGEVICNNCGMVVSENCISNYSSISTTSRATTDMATSLAPHNIGLSTLIGRTNRDANGNRIDTSAYSKMRRLRTWDLRMQCHTSVEKSFIIASNKLNRLKDELNLSDVVIKKSVHNYRKAQERKLIRGRTISAILAACVCIACRELEVPKTLKEVAEASYVSEKVLSKSYRLLKFELDIAIPLIDPIRCVAKIANKVNVNEKIKRNAIIIMKNIIDKEISASKDPMGLAGAALYMSCIKRGEAKTQAEIASAAGITEVTLRNRFYDMKQKLQLI
jgi:transcription initiation factor TFIIB